MSADEPAPGTPYFYNQCTAARIRAAVRWQDPPSVIAQRVADLAAVTAW